MVRLLHSMPGVERSLILICGRDRPGVSFRGSSDPAIPVDRLRIRRSTVPGGIRRLVQLSRQRRCDVVQSHWLWSIVCATVTARVAGVPVVITTEPGENRWKTGRHRWAGRAVMSRLADRRFCVSEAILRRRLESDGVPADRRLLVPNGNGLSPEPVAAVGRGRRFLMPVRATAQAADRSTVASRRQGDGPP